MSYVLGLDLGTSSLKGILMTKDGTSVITKSEEYALITPKTGYSEQDPAEWIRATKKVIREIIQEVPNAATELEGISFSGQMHSLVLLDSNNQVLRNAILWNDVRTTKQCQEITETLKDQLLKITKNRALEGFTLPKILWVKEYEPEVWKQVSHFLLPKDYLGYWLTGNQQMEYSDAAGTLLLDIERQVWSQTILDKFDISKDICPPLVYSTDCIGSIREELLDELGLQKKVKIFSGGADNACAAVGAGILKEGVALASIGTSGVFLTYEGEEMKDYQGQLHFFNHVIPNMNYSMGVTLSAGSSLEWLKSVCKVSSFEELVAGVNIIPVGSEGLLFTPYLVGERTPHNDSQIRGSFIGLDARHTQQHLVRSVMEGVTFSLKASQEIMELKALKKIYHVVSVGGGSVNKDWLQIQADIFNAEIITLSQEQGPGLGAAILAAVGLGWYTTIQECCEVFVSYDKRVYPIAENVEIYKRYYQLYSKIYSATYGISRELQDLLK